jgi:hypothetical protein
MSLTKARGDGGRKIERLGGFHAANLDLWKLTSVAGAFEPNGRYGDRVRIGELRSIESV